MRTKVVKEPEQMVSLVMKERVCERVDKIVDKLDVSRGYVIRRFVDEGLEKYTSNNKQVVGSSLDPLSI
jgi:hypothetical protein